MRLSGCEWKGAACLGLGGIFLGILSCAPVVTKEPVDIETVPFKEWSREELFQSLAERAQQFRSLRTLASVNYQGKDGNVRFQEAVVVQRPDRIRLETLSSFGALLIVTANADKVAGFDPREHVFVQGRSSKENLLRLTRIPLELREIVALLMGLPPVEIQGRWEGKQNSLYRELDDGRTEMITFHSKLRIPTKWERSGVAGRIELSALFADFFSTPAGLFPLTISIEDNSRQRRLEIRYQEPELNVALPSTLFVQRRPANVKEIPIESLGG